MVNPFISGAEQAAGRAKYRFSINIDCFGLQAADEKKHEKIPFLLMFCAGYDIRILLCESSFSFNINFHTWGA